MDGTQAPLLRLAGRRFRVRGLVQGVGFRPTVWRLATEAGLVGDVCNDNDGVLIHAWGSERALDLFAARLRGEPPPLARIDAIEVDGLDAADAPPAFVIAPTRHGPMRTAVVPDAATCAACVAEIRDPAARRHRHAFANCTHCGPRLSIVDRGPYDRAHTTMRGFALCDACRSEYGDPADRRFHAQPIACPACGPRLWLEDRDGRRVASDSDAAIAAAVAALEAGSIVAIKGLGGFHLACDATAEAAVARLRTRKRRAHKPFALMARDFDMVRRYATTTACAERELASAAAPIVLLQRRRDACAHAIAAAVAPGVDTLGFLLPYTPLHHLLFERVERPIVFTSGNRGDEPPCTQDDEARAVLGPIADLLLIHDRPIANRLDDSVVRVIAGEARVVRRARGFAPMPLRLPRGFEDTRPLLAMGAEQKGTFCLVKDGEAIVSPHLGDLERASTMADYEKQLALFTRLFDHRPVAIAIDRHPEYRASKAGRARASADGLALLEVQHHHAHVAACLAENGRARDAPRVLGIVLDGSGHGDDGTVWGGEFLLADYRDCTRVARLAPVALPGGEQAVREPWRSAYAHVRAAIGWTRFERDFGGSGLHAFLAQKPLATLDAMIDRDVNSPRASSCGRLFDAVAATLDVCRARAGYDGQPAIELEALAVQAHLAADDPGYPFAVTCGADGLVELDPAPLWPALLTDVTCGAARARVALRFHRGLARALCALVGRLGNSAAVPAFDTIALSGGVFQNALLFESVQAELAGRTVLSHRRFPCNDGGLSLGQAMVAAARLARPLHAREEEPACA